MRKSIKKIFWLYLLLFLLLIVYLLKLTLYDANSFVANPFNKRLSQSTEGIKRGSIYDSNLNVLAEDILQEDGSFSRIYHNEKNYYSHILGYITRGNAGIESKYNLRLTSISNELLQNASKIIGNNIEGNSLILTIDNNLQNIAGDLLGRQKGSIVALEPSTGRILAMVSYPSFDNNRVNEDWDKLTSDGSNSPLLNRATQGLYPPGSTFKIITAASAIENGNTSLQYKCTGAAKFVNSMIRCYDSHAHGNVDLNSAFAKSCNTYFSTLGVELGADKLIATASNFNFNKEIGLPLEYSISTFPIEPTANTNEIVETSFGQGRTLVSPLFMAMVTGAVANNGIMMQPYIVDYSMTPSGGIRNRALPITLSQAISPNTAYKLKELMTDVVKSGTAQNASLSSNNFNNTIASGESVKTNDPASITVAGKTGTAENPHGDDHAWFVAFAPAENPQIAVAVLLENVGKGSNAIPAARTIIKEYLKD